MNKKGTYERKIKGKNLVSNILLVLDVIFGTIPSFLVVIMVAMLMQNSITVHTILLCGLGIAISLTLKSVFYGLSIWKAHDAAYGVLTDIRLEMIAHLRKMSLGFFQSRNTGGLANIINFDVEQTELYLAHAMPEIMLATFVPSVAFTIVLVMDWRMGLALIATVPFVFLLRKLVNRMWTKSVKRYSDSTKKMSEQLLEYISTIPVIKAFSKDEQKTKHVLGTMQEYIHWVKKVMLSISVPMGLITLILEAGLVIMIITGSILLSGGQIDVQKFVLSLILGGIFTASFAKLSTFQHYNIVFNQSVRNIETVMNEQPMERSNLYTEASPGDIVFNDVSFGYSEDKEVLSNISVTFKKNTVNAIVGSSGCGKSTLASMVMGFWKPKHGSIYINGVDISDMIEGTLAQLVSIVQQDVFLFNRSIEENIRIGKPDATKDEIILAAKRAQIHDFITSLPHGYNTPAGESGVKLSGGEKQRISIARMMLKNAPIIILDEATAAIDPSNEHLIQKAINNLGEDKTIIMIAHHLNTITDADQIVVMDAGRVIAADRHDKLVKTCPQYSEMIKQQQVVDTWQIKEVSA